MKVMIILISAYWIESQSELFSRPRPNIYHIPPITQINSNNNGYCGEVSLQQSAMAHGTWISQYNVRSIATEYSRDVTQTGDVEGAPNTFQAQMSLAPPRNSGGQWSYKSKNSFAAAAENLKLKYEAYPSERQTPGEKVSRMIVV